MLKEKGVLDCLCHFNSITYVSYLWEDPKWNLYEGSQIHLFSRTRMYQR